MGKIELGRSWAMVQRESERLARIEDALRLLRSDPTGYGTCGVCGKEIEPARLDVVPWTRWCASCARGE